MTAATGSARARVGRAMTLLAGAAATRALLLGTATALGLLALVAVADLATPLDLVARRAMRGAALAGGALAAMWALWRSRRVLSPGSVALWLEERLPALEYSLVTALEAPASQRIELERAAARVPWRGAALRRVARSMRGPALALAIVAAVLAALPEGTRSRIGAPRRGDALERRGLASDPADRLSPLVVTVTAPRYAGGAASRSDDPATVSALVGSVVTVEGRGAPGVRATLSTGGPVVMGASGGRWSARFTVRDRAALLRLRDGDRERLLAVDGRPDAPPVVTLAQPARDTVLRVASGRLALVGEASDDHGLARAQFELIVSSGEGESFTFKSHALGVVTGGGRRTALRTTLSLDSLALKPGDIVHLRAVARDANDVSGPGVGSSETRTIRVARAGEYDSVAVEPAPPGIEEKSALSQRMLIMLTEALERRRPRLARPVLLGESQRISQEQAKLRKLVGEVIFMRLSAAGDEAEHSHADGSAHDEEAELLERARAATEQSLEPLDFAGGESPVVAINRPLLEAYNAMWDANRELDQGEPRRALPHMRRALAAIQRARQAERIYLRGRPPAAVVDLAKVRLTGKEKGDPGERMPLAARDTATASRARRLSRALALAPTRAGAAVDSLLVLRVEVVGDAPALAAALDALADALRQGRDATAAALRARRAVAGEPAATDSLSAWGSAAP